MEEETLDDQFRRMRVTEDQLVLSKRVISGVASNGKTNLTYVVDLPSLCNSTENISIRIEAGGKILRLTVKKSQVLMNPSLLRCAFPNYGSPDDACLLR
jgi:hypothetical protein